MTQKNTINKYCQVCGEEVSSDANFCPSCGASLKDRSAKSIVKSETKNSSKKNTGKNNQVETESGPKKLSGLKLFYISFLLVLIALLIIYSSGGFDSHSVATNQNVQNNNDPHKGVDLQHLQQINQLEEKLKTNPKDYVSLLDLAHLLNDSGFKEKAIEKYQIYLKANPKIPDVIVDMGVCYYELGKNEEAIKLMKEAIGIQKNHQIAHLNLGVINMSSGNHDESIEWFKKAVQINPNNEIGKRAQELINSH